MLPAISNSSIKNHDDLITLHLSLIEKALRAKPISGLSKKQAESRLKALDILHLYWQEGIYPKNLHFAYTLPVFIDEFGTACAVGHLMRETDGAALAAEISVYNNYSYLREMHYPQIAVWAEANGFEISELMWIQPAYSPSITLSEMISSPTCNMDNGSINITPIPLWGGVDMTAITYTWYNGEPFFGQPIGVMEDLVEAKEGFYSVSFEGAGFPGLKHYVLSDIEGPAVTAVITDEQCEYTNDGSIFLNLSNPENYEINWYNSNGEMIGSGQELSELSGIYNMGLMEGPPDYNYRVEVIDAQGCTTNKLFTVNTLYSSIYVAQWEESIQSPACGINNGAIYPGTVYGQEPIQYSWSTGATSLAIDNLNPGMYTLTITDVNGCTAERTYTLANGCNTANECLDLAGIDFGLCDMVLGIALVGNQCVSLAGCGWSVDGVDYAPYFFTNMELCMDCISGGGCMDLAGLDFGSCDMYLGLAVVNNQCVNMSGCGTEVNGIDYSAYFYDTIEACESCTSGGTDTLVYTICAGDIVTIGLDGMLGNAFPTWTPETNLTCINNCFAAQVSPSVSTLYTLTVFTTIGQTTDYYFYQVNIDPFCDECNYSTYGTVVDLTGLDGCGLVIQLQNGTYLEVASVPAGLVLTEGLIIKFDYILNPNLASICMVGPIVDITCFEIVNGGCNYDHAGSYVGHHIECGPIIELMDGSQIAVSFPLGFEPVPGQLLNFSYEIIGPGNQWCPDIQFADLLCIQVVPPVCTSDPEQVAAQLIAQLQQNVNCCNASSLTRYEANGQYYYMTNPGTSDPGQGQICPSNIPSTVYDCNGNQFCMYGGSVIDNICMDLVPQFINTQLLWTCSIEPNCESYISIVPGDLAYYFNAMLLPGSSASVFEWTVDGVVVGSGQNVVHHFDSAGPHIICLQSSSADGACTVNTCTDLLVNLGQCINPAQIDLSYPCPDDKNPVCGCDGITYSSSCEAIYYGGVTAYTPGDCNPGLCTPEDFLQKPWVQELISTIENDQFSCMCTLEIFSYNGANVLYVPSTNDCYDFPSRVFNCNGEVIVSSGGGGNIGNMDDFLNNRIYITELYNCNNTGSVIANDDNAGLSNGLANVNVLINDLYPCEGNEGFIGSWTWYQSTGGLAGITVPADHFVQLTLSADGSFTVCDEWANSPCPNFSGTYNIVQDNTWGSVIHFSEEWNGEFIGDAAISVDGDGHLHLVGTLIADGFEYQYLPDCPITLTVVVAPLYGTVTLGPDNNFVYTLNPGYNGPDSFTYQLCSTLTGDCDLATVFLSDLSTCVDSTLIDPSFPCPVDYLPVCGCDGNTYDNDCLAQHIGGVTSWIPGECPSVGCNPDTDPYIQDLLTAIANGSNTCICNIGLYTYQGQQVYYLDALEDCNSMDYPDAVFDCNGQFICATLGEVKTQDYCINWNEAVFISTIYACATPPLIILQPDMAETDMDAPVTICPLENDSIAGIDYPSLSNLSQPAHGTIFQSSDCIIYTPSSGYEGIDSFTYAICDDNNENCVTTTVTITITDTNGIANGDTDLGLSIYPNPFYSQLQIEWDEKPVYRIILYNMQGAIIYSEYTQGKNNVIMPVESLAEGIYLIQFHTDSRIINHKVEKLNK